MYAVEVRDVTVKLGGREVLSDITFSVEDGEFVTIMGPNGAGKTTLLRTILGLVRPSKGSVRVYGVDPQERPGEVRRMTGYVPQKEAISADIPIRVIDVVLMGTLIRKGVPRYPSGEDVRVAMDALKVVGMEWAWNKRFGELSGGQQQRVLIARSIATRPRLLLLDEPLTGVDATAQAMIAEFLSHIKSKGITVIMVTHDVNPVSHLSDKIMILNRRVVAFGRPKEVLRHEVLIKVYGEGIRVYDEHPCPVVVTGDAHHG